MRYDTYRISKKLLGGKEIVDIRGCKGEKPTKIGISIPKELMGEVLKTVMSPGKVEVFIPVKKKQGGNNDL